MNYEPFDISTFSCVIVMCLTVFGINYIQQKKDCTVIGKETNLSIFSHGNSDFPDCLNKCMENIKTKINYYEENSSLNNQIMIRNCVRKITVFTSANVQSINNDFCNSDFNCIQDRTNVILVNEIYTYGKTKSEFSINIDFVC